MSTATTTTRTCQNDTLHAHCLPCTTDNTPGVTGSVQQLHERKQQNKQYYTLRETFVVVVVVVVVSNLLDLKTCFQFFNRQRHQLTFDSTSLLIYFTRKVTNTLKNATAEKTKFYILLWENAALYIGWGTRWRNWLRHSATNGKVAGSIPDGVTEIFHWHNPSGRTMALGLTQPLTEMSTRNISWG